MPNHDFDAVVVGSGFGGSVVSCKLAEAGLRVCLLERGRAYPPGSFPRTQHGMAQNFWDPSRGRLGMFNVWSFQGLEALVSAGLGGGSLIYANVLLRKPAAWFEDEGRAWPVTREDLDPHYDEVERRLNAQTYPYAEDTPKTQALKDAARALSLPWSLPPLAVTFTNPGQQPRTGEPIQEASPNYHNKTRYTCRLCGECDIGCNYGSKNTLDFNYLSRASDHGADIRTLCEVGSLRPLSDGGYAVSYARHEDSEPYWRDTGRQPEEITTRRLILSAGTLGTTYLLLKNRRHFPELSNCLGARFCGNGDLLGFALNRPGSPELEPSFGPVITSTIQLSDSLDTGVGRFRGAYIQDAGFPAFLTWILEAIKIKSTLRRLVRAGLRRVRAIFRRDPRSDISSEIADALGNADLSNASLPLLGMGRDIPDGCLSLKRDDRGTPLLACSWTIDSSRSFFERVRGTMREIAEQWGARFVPNPTYRFGRVITVHPLGGCPMGKSKEEGVVDSRGEVFEYPGLYVADGSVMPGPVGPNPALTIAALADRTADHIIAQANGTP